MDAYLDPYREIPRPFECANCGKVDHGHSHCIPDLCEKVYCWKCGHDYFWGTLFTYWNKSLYPHYSGSSWVIPCNGCIRGIEETYIRHAPVEELPVLAAMYESVRLYPIKQQPYLLQVVMDRLQGIVTPPRTLH